MKFNLSIIIILATILSACGCKTENHSTQSAHHTNTTLDSYHTSTDSQLKALLPTGAEVPTTFHVAFALAHSPQHRQPIWVAHMLTRQRANGNCKKYNNFREDYDIPGQRSTLADYKNSGYDRGHMAPAGDMKWDSIALSESFLLSNMSPQNHSHNSGIWNNLERKVRQWANQFDTLYIFTGPIITSTDTTSIGVNRVTIPSAFYKIIYCPSRQKAVAFIIPHQNYDTNFYTYATTIDAVEEITGLDFLPNIENEEKIESTLDRKFWHLNIKY